MPGEAAKFKQPCREGAGPFQGVLELPVDMWASLSNSGQLLGKRLWPYTETGL